MNEREYVRGREARRPADGVDRRVTPGYESDHESALRLYADHLRGVGQVTIYAPSAKGLRERDAETLRLLQALAYPGDRTECPRGMETVHRIAALVNVLKDRGYTVTVLDPEEESI